MNVAMWRKALQMAAPGPWADPGPRHQQPGQRLYRLHQGR